MRHERLQVDPAHTSRSGSLVIALFTLAFAAFVMWAIFDTQRPH